MMELLKNVHDENKFGHGTLFRLYGVKRFDVIKIAEDLDDLEKKKLDYYDFILVNSSMLKADSFVLINVTQNSGKSGLIWALIENVPTEVFITAQFLKEHFKELLDQFYVDLSAT